MTAIVERVRGTGRPLVLLLGFPGPGLVGVIAADFLVRELGMERVGYVDRSDLPPVMGVDGGVVRHPIGIFQDGRTVVIKSEVPIPPDPLVAMLGDVLNWAKVRGFDLVLLLGGVGERERMDLERPGVFRIFSSRGVKVSRGDEIGGEDLSGGYISGFAAYFLREARRRGVPAAALLAQSFPNYPDPGAAASLIEALKPVLDREVNVESLERESEAIRLKLKELMRQTTKVMTPPEAGAAPSYIG